MTMTLERMQSPNLHLETAPDGKRVVRYAMQGWGEDIRATYWHVPRPVDLDPRQSFDEWRYCLPNMEGHGGTYSHPTEQGCHIAIVNFLMEVGIFKPSADNSHLDERNQEIAAKTIKAWNARTGRPRVGDFVRMPNGALRRCAHAWDDGMQTSDGGSFSTTTDGRASMSGSLYPSQLWEYFRDSGEVQPGRFWFFSHGRAGAGRGVDFYMPCRVYILEPFAMSEEEARAHPRAKRAAEFWGENHRDHIAAIQSLMTPAALTGGYC